jgi:hypothetical protein
VKLFTVVFACGKFLIWNAALMLGGLGTTTREPTF